MLPAGYRMRRSEEFGLAVRKGCRVGRPLLVVHLLRRDDVDELPRVGFVVSRGLGRAVVRNKVRRRLRHAMRRRLAKLPRGSLVVVRANPPAANAGSAELDNDLGLALNRLLCPRPRMRR